MAELQESNEKALVVLTYNLCEYCQTNWYDNDIPLCDRCNMKVLTFASFLFTVPLFVFYEGGGIC